MGLRFKVAVVAAGVLLLKKSGLWDKLTSRMKIAAVVGTVLAIIQKIKAKTPYPENSPEGGVEHLPIIGSMHRISSLQLDSVTEAWNLVRRTNYTAFEGLAPGGVAFQVITDPADFKHLLKDNWENYQKHDRHVGLNVVFKELLGSGIFAADGEQWRTHRKSASPLFTGRNLNNKMSQCFETHARQLTLILQEKARTGEVFDFQLLMSSLTFDTMCEIAFGHSPGALEQSAKGIKSEFLEAFDKAQTLGVRRMVTLPIVWKLQRYINKFMSYGPEGELAKSCEILDEYVGEIVTRRRSEILAQIEQEKKGDGNTAKGNLYQGDLLTLFIRAALERNDESTVEEMLSTKFLRDMVINFMVAGRDTTSCTLTNFVKLTTRNKARLSKLRAEFADLRASTGKGVTADSLLKNAPYADACFLETLRMYPPVPNDIRFAQNDDVMPSGFRIRKGAMVVICNIAAGRNPRVYTEPDTFDPERWIPQTPDQAKEFEQRPQGVFPTGVSRIDEYAHPVFWGGPRICLGRDVARLEVKMIAAHMMPQFDFEVLPHSEMFMNSPVGFYKHGLPVKVSKVVN